MALTVISMSYTEQTLGDAMSYPARRNPHPERIAEEVDTASVDTASVACKLTRGAKCP